MNVFALALWGRSWECLACVCALRTTRKTKQVTRLKYLVTEVNYQTQRQVTAKRSQINIQRSTLHCACDFYKLFAFSKLANAAWEVIHRRSSRQAKATDDSSPLSHTGRRKNVSRMTAHRATSNHTIQLQTTRAILLYTRKSKYPKALQRRGMLQQRTD